VIWLMLGGLALVVAVVLLQPLWRRRAPSSGEPAELAFYRDQLAEIERDAGLGTVTPAQAAASRIEIQRRLLAAADDAAASPAESAARSGWGPRLSLAVPLVAILLAGSLALYLGLGSPGAANFGAGGMMAGGGHPDAEFPQLVQQLQAKLKENPRDIEGWLLLARSLRAIDKLPEAAEAYMRALALSGGQPEIASAYGELMIEIAQGTVTPEALALFNQALARLPSDPRARFYVALSKAQNGDAKGAIADWSALLKDAPPDAPYIQAVREEIADASKSAGLLPVEPAAPPPHPSLPGPRVANLPPNAGGAPRGPTAADMAAAATMTDAQRQQMIRGMVDGLATRLQQNPADVDGWLRLARAYGVLGEPERAKDALAQAAKQAPERLDVLTAYADALYTPEKAADKPPAEYVALMRKILTLEPGNAQAMWFVANDAAETGDRAQAATLYKQLLDRLPPNAPLRPQVQRQLEAVQKGG
jgi:cytochrome c-type biogenesis protein CcmH